jgi:hypothetical protein
MTARSEHVIIDDVEEWRTARTAGMSVGCVQVAILVEVVRRTTRTVRMARGTKNVVSLNEEPRAAPSSLGVRVGLMKKTSHE